MATDAVGAETDLFTTRASADRLLINPVLLRWITQAHDVPTVTAGGQRMYTNAALRRVEAVLRAKDPGGVFRTKGSKARDPGNPGAAAATAAGGATGNTLP